MNVCIVRKNTSFLHTKAIESYHYTMFHGIACRGERGLPMENYNFGDELRTSLKLSINSYRLNPIIQPSLNLLVSKEVKVLLNGLAGVEFLAVEIVYARPIKYAEYDFSFWDNPSYLDDGEGPERVLLNAPNDLSSLPSGFAYYEVICPELFGMAKSGESTTQLEYNFPELFVSESVPVTREILERYPYLSFGSELIFEESLFEKLKKHFNPHYFSIQKVAVP